MSHRLSSISTFLEPYKEALRKALSEYEYEENAIKDCLDYDLHEAIIRTSHVVKATTVAWGAGFCIYAARLMTAIGARKVVIAENMPGKGSNIHKVLSIASLDYLNSWKKGQGISEYMLKDIISRSIEELGDLINAQNEDEIREIKDKATRMLKNLMNILPEALRRLGINYNLYGGLRFYTELELVDYKLHIWGVPDLLIEHPETRKAIVIEWKSDEEAPREVEKYQAYIYAMLEAIRLGHGESFNEIVNAIAPDNINDTKIIPIIIRPNCAYSDHPLYPISCNKNTKPASIEDIRDRLNRVIITSTYLTLLLMDIDALLYGVEKRREKGVITTREKCVAKRNGNDGGSIYILRMTPATLPRGYPMKQNGYPCIACPFSNERSKLQECKFYFGSFEKDRLDKLMWLYRFKVYRERDRDLLMYRALYLASELLGLKLHDFAAKIGTQFCGLKLDLESPRIYQYSCLRSTKSTKDTRSKCGIFEVNFEKFDTYENARVGVYDIMKRYSKGNDYDKSIDVLILKRKLLPCERLTRDEIPNIILPRIKQPVLVTLIENHVTYPTLGASLFGRVERTLSMGEEDEDLGLKCGDDEACVVITPISPYLRLPFRIFKRYINMYEVTKALVTEVGADLTNMDLATLHALHMSLKNAEALKALREKELEDITEDERKSMFNTVEETLNEAFNTYITG